MRKLIWMGLPCVFLLTACAGSSQQSYSSDGYESAPRATASYRSYDSAQSFNTSARSTPPFGNYPVNPNATCTTNCPGGNCRDVKSVEAPPF